MKKYSTIITVVLAVSIFLQCAYTFVIKQKTNQQLLRINELETKYGEASKEINNNSEQIAFYAEVIKKLEADYRFRKGIDDEPSYQEYKDKIKSILDEKIGTIISDKPLHKGKWFVTKVQFIGPTFALVYYEDGHNLFTSLVQIAASGSGYHFTEINGNL